MPISRAADTTESAPCAAFRVASATSEQSKDGGSISDQQSGPHTATKYIVAAGREIQKSQRGGADWAGLGSPVPNFARTESGNSASALSGFVGPRSVRQVRTASDFSSTSLTTGPASVIQPDISPKREPKTRAKT